MNLLYTGRIHILICIIYVHIEIVTQTNTDLLHFQADTKIRYKVVTFVVDTQTEINLLIIETNTPTDKNRLYMGQIHRLK
jgi:hypothetical protein